MTGTKTKAPVIAMKQTREGMTLNYRITDPNTADVLAQKLMQIFTQTALEKLSAQQEDGEAV